MKREYEVVIVVRLDTDEQTVNNTIEQVRGWIEAGENGSKVNKIDRWGRRKLAYEIDRQREGYYVLYNAEIFSRDLGELERNLNLNQQLLRYLIVRKED